MFRMFKIQMLQQGSSLKDSQISISIFSTDFNTDLDAGVDLSACL